MGALIAKKDYIESVNRGYDAARILDFLETHFGAHSPKHTGSSIRVMRPDKTEGIGAEIYEDDGVGTLFVFTSSWDGLPSGRYSGYDLEQVVKGYSPPKMAGPDLDFQLRQEQLKRELYRESLISEMRELGVDVDDNIKLPEAVQLRKRITTELVDRLDASTKEGAHIDFGKSRSVSDLLALPLIDESPYLVEKLLPDGDFTLLAAQEKIGKTSLVLSLCRALTGESDEFLGSKVTQRARVLYLDYELTDTQLQHQYLKGFKPTEDLVFYNARTLGMPNLFREKTLEKLARFIDGEGITYVVYDTLSNIIAASGMAMTPDVDPTSNNALMSFLIQSLKDVLKPAHGHMLVHHSGKGFTDSNGQKHRNPSRGASSIPGAADSIWNLIYREPYINELSIFTRLGGYGPTLCTWYDRMTGLVENLEAKEKGIINGEA